MQLARHFEVAGDAWKAVKYLGEAGKRAARLSANEEAIAHFNQGLALLATLPETRERALQEVALQLGLVAPLQAARGYAVPEVGRAYTWARELCQQLGDEPQLITALWLLSSYYGMHGEFRTAREMMDQLLPVVPGLSGSVVALEPGGTGAGSKAGVPLYHGFYPDAAGQITCVPPRESVFPGAV